MDMRSTGGAVDDVDPDALAVGILGPLDVAVAGRSIALTGPKVRALLALLVVHADRVLTVDRLVEDLWDGGPPAGGIATLQSHVSHLRRALGQAGKLLVTRPGGYVLRLERAMVDALRFEDAVDRLVDDADPGQASARLAGALALWRGPALLDVEPSAWARAEAARLDELRVSTLEARIDADLARGRSAGLVPELERLVDTYPLRERLWKQLMLALYRGGRQVDALRAAGRLRAALAEVGVELGLEVARLETAILLQSADDGWAGPVASPARPAVAAVRPPSVPPVMSPDGIPFVGRAAERAVLDAAVRAACDGHRRVVLVAGDPGVGKTRLAHELMAGCRAGGHMVLAGRCDDEMGLPHQPVVEALERYVWDEPNDERLIGSLGTFPGELSRLLPELAVRLPSLPAPLQSDPEVERYRMFQAVCSWLAGAAPPDRAAVLVVDDLHWATKPTLLLLRHVIRSELVDRLCLVLLYRGTENVQGCPLAAFLAEIATVPGLQRVELAGLDAAETHTYVEAAIAPGVSDQLTTPLHDATGGNPFYVGEMLRQIVESGRLSYESGVWRLGDTPTLQVPEGVRGVVAQRVARLSRDAVDLLRCASVHGQEFDLSVVAHQAGLDEERLTAASEEALLAHLIVAVGGPQLLRHRFYHALVRATIYEGLSSMRRARLHRDAAVAIEAVHPRLLGDHVADLARHYAEAGVAGDLDKVILYGNLAGHRARERRAPDEAVEFYSQALRAMDTTGQHGTTERCELLLDLAEAQRSAGDPDQRVTFQAASRLARELGDLERMARAGKGFSRSFVLAVGGPDPERTAVLEAALGSAGPGDSPIRARLLASLAGELALAGERDRSRATGAAAVAVARRCGDLQVLAVALGMHADVILHPATLTQRRTIQAELVALASASGDPVLAWQAEAGSFACDLEEGDLAAAAGHLDRARQLSEELVDPFTRSMTLLLEATNALIAGDVDTTDRLTFEAWELGSATTSADLHAAVAAALVQVRAFQGRLVELAPLLTTPAGQLLTAQPVRALIALAAGRPHEARAILRELSADGFSVFPPDVGWPFALVNLAEVCARVGDARRAATLHDLLAPHRGQFVGYRTYWLGSFAHYLGLLNVARGRLDAALADFQAAAESHERIPAPAFLARTQLEWAGALRLRDEPGDRAQADALVAEAGRTVDRLGLEGLREPVVTPG